MPEIWANACQARQAEPEQRHGYLESIQRRARSRLRRGSGHGFNRRAAESLARRIIDARLGACVQIEAIQSIYRWQGRVCNEPEFRLLIKRRYAKFDELARFTSAHHSYDTPEIVQLPITAGSSGYLQWLDDSTGDQARLRLAGTHGKFRPGLTRARYLRPAKKAS